jgi:CheY-like chemotaxis protein
MDGEGQTSLLHLNVLVAEDNPINLRLMNKKLSRRGHKVDLACDGQECHDQYVSNTANIDVILMDMKVSSFPRWMLE